MEPNNQNQNQISASAPATSKKPMNPLLVAGLVYALVVAVLIIAIILVATNRKPASRNAAATPTVVDTPMALAKSVCESYGGEFKDSSEARFGGSLSSMGEYLSDAKICEKYTHQDVSSNSYNAYHADGTPLTDDEIQDVYGVSIGPNDFSYEIGIMDEENGDEFKTKIIDSVVGYAGYEDVSRYIILENSDELFKACTSMAGMMIFCEAFYGDTFLIITAQSYAIVDDLFVDLGFPDRARLADYASGDSSSNDDETDDKEDTASQSMGSYSDQDLIRIQDYSKISTIINRYLDNFNGGIRNLLGSNLPAISDTYRLMGEEDAKDPNGNPYEIWGYDYESWSDGGVLPSGDSKTQVFVVISANCDGTDDDGNPQPAAARHSRLYAVYGYLEKGYYCYANS